MINISVSFSSDAGAWSFKTVQMCRSVGVLRYAEDAFLEKQTLNEGMNVNSQHFRS